MTSKVWQNGNNGIIEGVLIAGVVFALGAYFNYSTPYDPNPVTAPTTLQLILWALLYAPLGLMVMMRNWGITEFGFHITSRLGLGILIVIFLCGFTTWSAPISWQATFFEAFARTGEEIFFRGFLFVLLLKIFRAKTKPWIWAVSISALLFSLIHTQTFQMSFLDNYGTGSTVYKIFERFLNVFLLGLFLALLRHWTSSVLPEAIMHSLFAAGIFTLPFCLGIYGVITLWAFIRKEDIVVHNNNSRIFSL